MTWLAGDVSGSQTLTDNDHLYASHINELRTAVTAATSNVAGLFVVGATGSGADYEVDGVADDVQINAAITAANAAGGGTVFVLPGLYTIADMIQIKSNVTLKGTGIDVTTIKAVNAYNPATTGPNGAGDRCILKAGANPISNIIIEGITWDGNVQNTPGVVVFSQTIHIVNATNLTFRNNKVTNGINWALFFRNCTDLWIEDNIVLGGNSSTYSSNDGIHVRGSSNVFITGNYADTNGTGTSGDDAIAVGVGVEDTTPLKNVVISQNVASSYYANGIRVFQEGAQEVRDINVINNQIKHVSYHGIALTRYATTSAKLYDIVIANNDIYDTGYTTVYSGPKFGIEVFQEDTTDGESFKGLSILNNTIRNNQSTTGWGIKVWAQVTGLTISGNILSDLSGLGGISIGTTDSPISNLVVTANYIDFSAGASDGQGILIFAVQKGTVQGNTILGHTTGTTYGIILKASAANNCKYINVAANSITTVDNGISEVNSGANPDSNQYLGNLFTSVTTYTTILGGNSRLLEGNAGRWGIGTSIINPNPRLHVAVSGLTGKQQVAYFGDDAVNTNALVLGYDQTSNAGWIGAITDNVAWRSVHLVPDGGNIKIGGTANRGTTEGAGQLVIFNGTAPVGTLTNGASFYAAAGEMRVMDSAGNSTLLSPHDHETNEWIFYSKNTVTGKVIRIDMERMMRVINDKLGGGFINEYIE